MSTENLSAKLEETGKLIVEQSYERAGLGVKDTDESKAARVAAGKLASSSGVEPTDRLKAVARGKRAAQVRKN